MGKEKIIHACSKCGAQSLKWSGRCLECGAWGTLSEEAVEEKILNKTSLKAVPGKIFSLEEIDGGQERRVPTGVGEIDRVLGGGFVPGSLLLLAGEPGAGKSTLAAQIARTLEKKGEIIYASGEESLGQIKTRLERMGFRKSGLKLLGETQTEKIITAAEERSPLLLIVDSIQTARTSAAEGEAGGINQIRASAAMFLELAKKKNIIVILIGHITKDGLVAGPKTLEHMVDAVLTLETESRLGYRLLRASKNRFGANDELGVFEMLDSGFREAKNPSAIFLEKNEEKTPGSSFSCIMEGSRPFLVEIQALATKTVFGYPQRKASGFDLNRLQILSAVLTKRGDINLSNQDLIVNIVGGLKTNDPALDLALSLAIASSLLNQPLERDAIALGEIGLGGEIRNVSRLEQRLKEAEKLGFKKAFIPNVSVKAGKIELVKIKNLKDLVKTIFN